MSPSSFVDVAEDSPFSIHNIPFGVFSTSSDRTPRMGAAIGTYIVDLKALTLAGILAHCECAFPHEVLTGTTLNDFAALGRKVVSAVRLFVQSLLLDTTSILRVDAHLRDQCLTKQSNATMHLPFAIGDFTDFTSSRTHAKNTHSSHGSGANMFNPPRAAAGRASSILPSGVPIVRPVGHLFDKKGNPYVGPSNELDVELELGFFVGVPSKHFQRIHITQAEDHIFGVVLLNDWSTRDVQRGEDHPFSAFNAKNFATSISPWVVTLDALEPFRVKPDPRDDRDMLPYLTEPDDSTYDIRVCFEWNLAHDRGVVRVTTSELKHAYWSFKQMDPSSLCSLVEATKNNTKPFVFPRDTTRSYLEDGDQVVFTAWCGALGSGVGFGECSTVILPARE
ncbi:hypothetical protein HYDPIDRAFT_28123 [Hydnomerulius pinastri MD-312]|uniref:Fumarylacetoacetase n=1 Tax=Hydnomerulius pinastri MD-312 TaxID=994086 RepID=A0A0C9WFF2_9AGAM|nr:hypothetical protein HYDPIDRAFT_28123 [Hydnomerulius pinastri MD-312]